MALRNPWVGYVQRGYLQIKNSVLNSLGVIVPEVTDHSQSNILVVILDTFAGVAEMLNYYIDNMAREAFITTARKYSSMVRLSRLIDYRIKAAIPSSGLINITFPDNLIYINPGVTTKLIPRGTNFKTDNNIEYITTEDFTFDGTSSNKSISIPIEQKTLQENQLLGQTNGDSEQVISLGENYAHNTLSLEIGGEVWEGKETLGLSSPTDKVFIVEISAEKIAFIRFGEGINGATPDANQNLVADYYTTKGRQGNVDPDNITLTDLDFSSFVSNDVDITITNTLGTVAGTNYEDIERIRRSAPLSIRTLDRAVTRQDFKDIARLTPGVDKANLEFECGKPVTIYISPNGGGVAQQPLLDSTFNYIEERKILGIQQKVLSAGESYLYINALVTAKFRRDPIVTKTDIIKVLEETYSYLESDINKPIRKSDLMALIDNQEKVDYLDLVEFYLIPYFRPRNNNSQIAPVFKLLPGSTNKIHWGIQYTQGTFILKKEGLYYDTLTPGVEYTSNNGVMKLTLPTSGYNEADEWEFTTYPYNQNIETADFTIPIVKEEILDITVIEQLTTN